MIGREGEREFLMGRKPVESRGGEGGKERGRISVVVDGKWVRFIDFISRFYFFFCSLISEE